VQVCGSGLKAIQLGAQAIMCGDASVVIAGGQESMSLAPHALTGSRTGQKIGDWTMTDTMIKDGLWCAFNDYHIGVTAENIASEFEVTRAQQDEFAAQSQAKAAAAQKVGTLHWVIGRLGNHRSYTTLGAQ
jgi:acetyl-CoA C-acetyltransferase